MAWMLGRSASCASVMSMRESLLFTPPWQIGHATERHPAPVRTFAILYHFHSSFTVQRAASRGRGLALCSEAVFRHKAAKRRPGRLANAVAMPCVTAVVGMALLGKRVETV